MNYDNLLPDFLFYRNEEKSKSISPGAIFNVKGALSGSNSFKNSTTPSQKKNKKTLIITANSFDPFYDEQGESIALLTLLNNADFNIYLKVTGDDLKKIDLTNSGVVLVNQLNNLCEFDNSADYKKLAKFNIEYDHALVLECKQITLIKRSLYKTTAEENHPCINAFQYIDDKLDFESGYKFLGRKIESIRDLIFCILNLEGTAYEDKINAVFENFCSDNNRLLNMLSEDVTSFEKELENSLESVGNFNCLVLFEIFITIKEQNEYSAKNIVGSMLADRINKHLKTLKGRDPMDITKDELRAYINSLRTNRSKIISNYKQHVLTNGDGFINKYDYPVLFAAFPARVNCNLILFYYHLFAQEDTSINSPLDTDEIIRKNSNELEKADMRVIDYYNIYSLLKHPVSEFLIENTVVKLSTTEYDVQEDLDVVMLNLGCSYVFFNIPVLERCIVFAMHGLINAPHFFRQSYYSFCFDSSTGLDDLIELKPNKLHNAQIKLKDSNQNKYPDLKYIYISHLDNQEKITYLSELIILDKIIALKVDVIDKELQKEFLAFIKKMTSLKYLTVIKPMINSIAKDLENLSANGLYISILDLKNSKEINCHDNEKLDSEMKPDTDVTFLPNQTQKSKIYTSNQSTGGRSVSTEDGAVNFTMVEQGEVLNNLSQTGIQIRCAIETYNINKDLSTTVYVPKQYTEVSDVAVLTADQIKQYRQIDCKNGTYYLLHLSLKMNDRTKLFSADTTEELIAIKGIPLEQLTIERGDDDFFYATTQQNCTISYVTYVKKHLDYTAIENTNPIKKIINEYKNSASGYKPSSGSSSKLPKYDHDQHEQWLSQLYDGRLGSCEHRVAAMLWKLSKDKNINKKDFRVVDINNNHVALEIKHNNLWYSADLGGGESELTYVDRDKTPIADKISSLDIDLQHTDIFSYRPITIQMDLQPNVKPIKNQDQPDQTPDLEQLQYQDKKQQFRQEIQRFFALEKISTADELFRQVTNRNKTLIVTGRAEKIAEQINFLLKNILEKQQLAYCIDSPQKIDIGRNLLFIDQDTQAISIRKTGLLEIFLKSSIKKKTLIINWDNFNNKEKIKLNTVLDTAASIQGKIFDKKIKIISFCSAKSKDPSFMSRHNQCLDSSTLVIPPTAISHYTNELIIIDLQGLPNWQEALFGSIVLNGKEMQWQQSTFVSQLSKGTTNFKIINIDVDTRQRMTYAFDQAKAWGYFEYNGYRIKLPTDFKIHISEENFDFSQFNNDITLYENLVIKNCPDDCTIINSYLFDQLLHRKEIKEGNYRQVAGLIENVNNNRQVLKLFITAELSTSQYYCLFFHAQKHKVKLELYIGKGIPTPKMVNIKPILLPVQQDFKQTELRFNPQVVIAKDPTATISNYSQGDSLLINIEDFGYQDLIKEITFITDSSGFRGFKEITSDILDKLKNKKQVILTGEFTIDLLQMLHPLLVAQKSEFQNIENNLCVIIEDKNNIGHSLEWLATLVFDKEIKDISVMQRLIYEETPNLRTDLSDSVAVASKFINDRLQNFKKFVGGKGNAMLQMIGHSGVGKSNLINKVEEDNKSTVIVYRELSAIQEWAINKDDKTKILFIDEANIENAHLTMFSSLKKGGNKQLLCQGKVYQLTVLHKVVFAVNPKEYGGGRVDQKLFADGSIPQLILTDFPAGYIYEKLLKEVIYDKISNELKSKIKENDFKLACQTLIENYQKHNLQESKNYSATLTVRELQEKVLLYLANKHQPIVKCKIETDNFISTTATEEVEASINNCLVIRQLQREKVLTSKAVGTNGVVLIGDAGTGKSEMIKAVLNKNGIYNIQDYTARPTHHNSYYFKIDASLTLEEKRVAIIYAFNEGMVIWIDEINSCIDDGLEKLLNSVLTGAHPLTGAAAKKAWLYSFGYC
jgi:predicted AAA+ superfamily ATPase